MKDAIFQKEEEEEEEEEIEKEDDEAEIGEKLAPPSSAVEARPWNLRTRRTMCKALIGPKGLRIEERKVNYSPLRSENNNNGSVSVKSQRLKKRERKAEDKVDCVVGEERGRRRFHGDDWPKASKKAQETAQNCLEANRFDSYKVPEFADNGKVVSVREGFTKLGYGVGLIWGKR